jgi:predicted nucleic acid-binding protein
MPLVVDASVTASWLLVDKSDPRAEAAFEQFEGDLMVVPAVWWFETRNSLVMNQRRGRIDEKEMHRALEMLDRLPMSIDREPNSAHIVELAQKHRLPVYDAAYLELAIRLDLPLATLDEALTRAAAVNKVPLVG